MWFIMLKLIAINIWTERRCFTFKNILAFIFGYFYIPFFPPGGKKVISLGFVRTNRRRRVDGGSFQLGAWPWKELGACCTKFRSSTREITRETNHDSHEHAHLVSSVKSLQIVHLFVKTKKYGTRVCRILVQLFHQHGVHSFEAVCTHSSNTAVTACIIPCRTPRRWPAGNSHA